MNYRFKKENKIWTLQSECIRIRAIPYKNHLKFDIYGIVNFKRIRRRIQTSIGSMLTTFELKCALIHAYKHITNEENPKHLEHCNYAQVFGSRWF